MKDNQSVIKIRKAKLSDLYKINDIGHNVLLDIPGFVWGQPSWNEEKIKAGWYWVATDNSLVVGVICLEFCSDGIVIGHMLSVAETHQRLGVGTKLIEFAKRLAKKKKMQQLQGCSFLEYDATDFYLKCGAKRASRQQSFHGHKYNCFNFDL